MEKLIIGLLIGGAIGFGIAMFVLKRNNDIEEDEENEQRGQTQRKAKVVATKQTQKKKRVVGREPRRTYENTEKWSINWDLENLVPKSIEIKRLAIET